MECKTVGSCLKRVVISKMCMNKKEDLCSAIMSRCSNILSLRGSPPLILYTIITIVILLPSACFGETVKVTTLAEVIGNDGTDVEVPCSFTVTPAPSGDQDYVLRWIKYPEGATFYNVYNYNGEGEFDGPVNEPAEGRYTRTNQDLNIPSFGLVDQGKLCCEIVLLPDMTATDSNCTQVKYVDFSTDAWKAVDKKNTSLIVNPDYYITAIPPVTLEVNISYNEIYPPCDLVLYRRTTEGGNDVLTQLDQKLQSQVTAVNGRYSLLMEAKQPVDCTGQDVITRLVARLENCLITSPQYEAEKHFTVVCSETCSPVCENGGTCENGVCQCTQDYTGISCKCRKDNPCVGCNFCMNGGTCSYDDGKGLCECPVGWSGVYCETDACDEALPTLKQGCIKKGQIAVPNAEICECQCENCSPNNCNGNGYPKSLVCNSTTCNRGRCDWKCSGVNCICDEGFCGPTCNTQLKCFNDKSPVRIKGNLTESIEFTARLNSTEGCQCHNITKGRKNGEKVVSENCLTLKIDELSVKDNNTRYYVQAVKNRLKDGQCLETLMIYVTVNEPSWNITSDQTNTVSVSSGDNFTWSAGVYGGSPPPNNTNIYLLSNHTSNHTIVKRSTDDTSMEDWVQVTNSPYNNKATLMLDSVKPDDAGEYVCIAKLLDYSAIISSVTLIVTASQPPPCHSTDCLIIVIVVCVGIALNFFLLLACCCGKKKPSRIDWTDTFIHPCRAVHYVAIIICIILPFVGFCVAIAIFIHIECSKSSGGSKSKVLASPRISPSHLKPDRRPSTANMNKVQPEIEQNGHTAGGAPQAATKYQVSVAPTAPLMPSVATPAWQEAPPPEYYGPRLDQPRRPSITNPPRRDSTDSGLHLSVRPAMLPNVPSNASIAAGAGGDNDGAAGDGYQGHPLPPPLLGKLEPLEHHTEKKKKKKSKKEKRRSKEDVEDDAGKEGNGVANDGYNSIKL